MNGMLPANSYLYSGQENHGEYSHALFLARLAQTLLPLKEPDRIFETVCREVGQYLNADRCFMDETTPDPGYRCVHADYHPGLPSLAGVYPLDLYPAQVTGALSHGNLVTLCDGQQNSYGKGSGELFDRAGFHAMLCVPSMREKRWVATLFVSRGDACSWPPSVTAVLQFTTELTWLAVENARHYQNMKISEERLRVAVQNTGLTLFSCDLDLRYTWVYTAGVEPILDPAVGKRDSDWLPARDAIELSAIKRRVLETGTGAHLEFTLHLPDGNRVFEFSLEPLRSATNEVTGLTGVAIDVTERHKAEDLARHNAAQIETNRLIQTDREIQNLEIAQSLHDGPLQMAMALVMDLNEALLIDGKSERLEKLNVIRAGLQTMAQDLRDLCAGLRPPALAPFGLEKAIRSHLETFQRDHPHLLIRTDLMCDGLMLPEEVRLGMFRIYQELVENTVCHGCASHLFINLTLDEAQTELEIRDDGQGFVLPPNWLDLARQGHYGLVKVFERAEALKGRVSIRTAPGQGTLVRVIIPRDMANGPTIQARS